jgi:hypothetical protein
VPVHALHVGVLRGQRGDDGAEAGGGLGAAVDAPVVQVERPAQGGGGEQEEELHVRQPRRGGEALVDARAEREEGLEVQAGRAAALSARVGVQLLPAEAGAVGSGQLPHEKHGVALPAALPDDGALAVRVCVCVLDAGCWVWVCGCWRSATRFVDWGLGVRCRCACARVDGSLKRGGGLTKG